ncbi:MAG TPA: tRNA preQ1(34) S-adenosylmethionine ribosyltransferase-isomerase QueA [Gammaproteobacteria bacterium]|jgi:S-adenosylmethionine:tRNA ribosyltransferase-isomerase|uniref:tRNA preQ1(34) S-adenosylmethionine ribosyltransferase-isomerase QueA n=1 Tax=Immundisolibacter sp. TaxID=1934948 RepID=UPI000E80C305|nr:tRNA preQ1(34) S-adenosylmethionine ribosyltransferase-isomerase QueA [Gammaproteobacteria bacterium]MCH77598.1 tRNA preQ1(34) S-adenosylmethionine ribosyltransferase-isomerase QueA [Gammaproteobacteria bacterium]
MRRQDFHYALPERLIAQHPLAERTASRLLYVPAAAPLQDRSFTDLPSLLRPGDLLVLNDTRVIRARLRGRRASGGRVEALIERLQGEYTALVQLRGGKSLKPGAAVTFAGGGQQVVATLGEVVGEFRQLRFDRPVRDWLDTIGQLPLPPYITRQAGNDDENRYQTVYGQRPGAVAAPTAGLHFDAPLLERLRGLGVQIGQVTLHVGAGTFKPVRVEDLHAHRMHAEWLDVSPEVCAQVAATHARGGRVVAVGTTVVRALESAAADGALAPFVGETRLFITPGYRFRVVDALITNFHLPESTLLMLVCAFGGYEAVMAAYRHAVSSEYRFFSYGDAMLLERTPCR